MAKSAPISNSRRSTVQETNTRGTVQSFSMCLQNNSMGKVAFSCVSALEPVISHNIRRGTMCCKSRHTSRTPQISHFIKRTTTTHRAHGTSRNMAEMRASLTHDRGSYQVQQNLDLSRVTSPILALCTDYQPLHYSFTAKEPRATTHMLLGWALAASKKLFFKNVHHDQDQHYSPALRDVFVIFWVIVGQPIATKRK